MFAVVAIAKNLSELDASLNWLNHCNNLIENWVAFMSQYRCQWHGFNGVIADIFSTPISAVPLTCDRWKSLPDTFAHIYLQRET